MRNRDSSTRESVIQRYLAILGYKQVMHLTGYSRAQVYAWADDDMPSFPAEHVRLDLDRACLDADSCAPYRDWYNHQLEAMDAPEPEQSCIRSAGLGLGAVVGQVLGAIEDAVDEDGEGGPRITPRERDEIDKRLKGAVEQLTEVKQILDAEARQHNQVNRAVDHIVSLKERK